MQGVFGPQAHYAITMMGTRGGTLAEFMRSGANDQNSNDLQNYPSVEHAIVNR